MAGAEKSPCRDGAAAATKVKKTSRNSSLPPSKGFKPNQSSSQFSLTHHETPKRHNRGGRELHPHPDQTVVAQAKRCPHYGVGVKTSTQSLVEIYERIELPPVNPYVTQVQRYGGTCGCCQKRYESPVPVGLEPGSPFGMSVASVVTYLRYSHAVSYQRLNQVMAEVYGLGISEEGIANLLHRVQIVLEAPVTTIVEHLRRARLIGSDETSARVSGQNQWEWVFQNEQVCPCDSSESWQNRH